MSPIEQFTTQASQLAVRLGIRFIVIAVRDETTKVPVIVASPGAMDNLREHLAEKLGLPIPGETGWDG